MASPRPHEADDADHVFPFFPRFPLEIRWMIWEYCLPHRVVELDACCDWLIDDTPSTSTCEFTTTSTTNCAPPTISRVCREAREVALRHAAAGVWPLAVPQPLAS